MFQQQSFSRQYSLRFPQNFPRSNRRIIQRKIGQMNSVTSCKIGYSLDFWSDFPVEDLALIQTSPGPDFARRAHKINKLRKPLIFCKNKASCKFCLNIVTENLRFLIQKLKIRLGNNPIKYRGGKGVLLGGGRNI